MTLSHPAKRLSIPACDHSSKLTAVLIRSTSPGVLTDARHHHHVTSSCDTSNHSNQHLPIDNLQAVVYKSSSSIANNQVSSFQTLPPPSRKESIHSYICHWQLQLNQLLKHAHLFILQDVASLLLIVFSLGFVCALSRFSSLFSPSRHPSTEKRYPQD